MIVWLFLIDLGYILLVLKEREFNVLILRLFMIKGYTFNGLVLLVLLSFINRCEVGFLVG